MQITCKGGPTYLINPFPGTRKLVALCPHGVSWGSGSSSLCHQWVPTPPPKFLGPYAWLTRSLLAEDNMNYGPNIEQMFWFTEFCCGKSACAGGEEAAWKGGFLPQRLPSGKKLRKSSDAGWSGLGRTPCHWEQPWLCTARRVFLHGWPLNSQEEPHWLWLNRLLTGNDDNSSRSCRIPQNTHPHCRKDRGPASLLMSANDDGRQCVALRTADRPSAPMEPCQFTLRQI